LEQAFSDAVTRMNAAKTSFDEAEASGTDAERLKGLRANLDAGPDRNGSTVNVRTIAGYSPVPARASNGPRTPTKSCSRT
jgi:hypothetical protein